MRIYLKVKFSLLSRRIHPREKDIQIRGPFVTRLSIETRLIETCVVGRKLDGERLFAAFQVHRPVLFPLYVHLVTRVAASLPPFFVFHSIFLFFFSSPFLRLANKKQDERERERRKILTKKGRREREGFSLVGRTFTKEQKATGQGGKS